MALRKFILKIILLGTLLGNAAAADAQYNKDYFYWASRRCLMNREYQEAIRVLNILLRADPDAAEGYFLRGVAKFNLDDLLGADTDFSAAIVKNPVFTTAYIYRALTRTRMGNYDDALQDFREAIDLRPDLPDAYYSRGYTRLQNKQYEEAIEDFDKFIFQENKVADAYIGRGTAYLYLKDTVRALENFDQAIRTNRENPNGYYQRGTLLLQKEEYARAEADFDMSIRCDSAFLPPYFNRAVVYSNTNRPMQALADFDRVLQLDSTNSFTYFNRAILRTQIGDYSIMYITCLDVEGVLVPEIWIAFAEASGIPELKKTTRDEPDYDKLMNWRLGILKEHGLGLKEIQDVIAKIDPLPGAKEFLDDLRSFSQVILISDTFTQFAAPLMEKLGRPTLFCNTLEVADNGEITGFKMRVEQSKLTTVKALQSIGFDTIASGDSYNDLGMIQASKAGFLFRSTDKIKADYPEIPAYEEYDELLAAIKNAMK